MTTIPLLWSQLPAVHVVKAALDILLSIFIIYIFLLT